MKKNLRIVSLAAAALLAVSPVVASASNIANADVTVNVGSAAGSSSANAGSTVNTPTDRPYFTYKGTPVAEASASDASANVIRGTYTIKPGEKVGDLINAINADVKFHNDNNDGGQALTIKPNDLRDQLKLNHVTFTTATDKHGKKVETYTIKSVPANSFNISLTGNYNGRNATIQIPIVTSGSTTTPTADDSPVFKYTENNGTAQDLNGHVFQVAVNSNFDPTNFVNSNGESIHITAWQTKDNQTLATISNTSNPVNTTEAGRYYNVTLTATGLTGKTSTATYTVLITSSHKQPLYGNGTIQTYNIYGNNVFSGSTAFKTGDQVYVADGTRTINNVSYSQVSTKSKSDASSSNIWVKTADLTKPATPAETSEEHTVMVTSKAYDKNGNYLGHNYQYTSTINIVPKAVLINGKTYYKVAGKDEYVRVTNITGTPRTLRHNAYIYWSSYRRTPGTGKMYRGQHVTTYGAAIRFKNGKRYYRISGCTPSNKRYIKQANFF